MIARKICFPFQVLLIAVATVFYSVKVILKFVFTGKDKKFYEEIASWSRKLLAIAGVKVETVHSENFPPDETFVYLSNHSSLFDIPVFLSTVDRHSVIIYKRELEKIPIFGYGLKKSPLVSINRTDPREAFRGLEEAGRKIKSDISVLVFPEGTRSTDGLTGAFKRGAFVLAGSTGKRVVPITIKDTFGIMPKGKKYFAPRTVKIIYGRAHELPDFLDRNAEKAFVAEIREEIISGLS